MSEFETPIMRDVSRLLMPVCIGVILAVVLLFSLNPMNFIYYSLQWELEQLDHGFTWADKQPNGCFENINGVTYYDDVSRRQVTSTGSCSSSALPWEFLIWSIPLTIGLIIGLIIGCVILFKYDRKLDKEIQDMKTTSQKNQEVKGN